MESTVPYNLNAADSVAAARIARQIHACAEPLNR